MHQKKIKNYYKVNFKIGKKEYNLNGYLDTGNDLSYNGKVVILTNIKIKSRKRKIFVPFITISGNGVIECIETTVNIDGLGKFNVLLGYSENFKISGAEVLLNNKMEEKNARKN